MAEIEIRDLRYAIAVAEELSFTRAAERLGIAQPPLSRAIGRLERRLGFELFRRTSRSVALTESGRVFVAESRSVLQTLDIAVRRARSVDRARPLVVAVRPATGSGLLGAIFQASASQRAEPIVHTELTRDPVQAVRDYTADIALICATDDSIGLLIEKLRDQPTVALLPPGDELAGRTELRLADVQSHPGFLQSCPDLGLDELVDLIVLSGRSLLVSSDVADRTGGQPCVVPVLDAPPTTLCLAWRTSSDQHPHLAAFIAQARRVARTYPAGSDIFLSAEQVNA